MKLQLYKSWCQEDFGNALVYYLILQYLCKHAHFIWVRCKLCNRVFFFGWDIAWNNKHIITNLLQPVLLMIRIHVSFSLPETASLYKWWGARKEFAHFSEGKIYTLFWSFVYIISWLRLLSREWDSCPIDVYCISGLLRGSGSFQRKRMKRKNITIACIACLHRIAHGKVNKDSLSSVLSRKI